ncbi:hypothetical protein HK097_001301 [Rhizophlyctis rosea]|uniref:SHSP domain-containing protein n=1 Tax=Rhizophlyctis rosea TaxID=64517 RepID=A0AAD5S4I6_9FUNG|nr:hypothetical protein HK097_001301 [Rhizophlyctis rosea]
MFESLYSLLPVKVELIIQESASRQTLPFIVEHISLVLKRSLSTALDITFYIPKAALRLLFGIDIHLRLYTTLHYKSLPKVVPEVIMSNNNTANTQPVNTSHSDNDAPPQRQGPPRQRSIPNLSNSSFIGLGGPRFGFTTQFETGRQNTIRQNGGARQGQGVRRGEVDFEDGEDEREGPPRAGVTRNVPRASRNGLDGEEFGNGSFGNQGVGFDAAEAELLRIERDLGLLGHTPSTFYNDGLTNHQDLPYDLLPPRLRRATSLAALNPRQLNPFAHPTLQDYLLEQNHFDGFAANISANPTRQSRNNNASDNETRGARRRRLRSAGHRQNNVQTDEETHLNGAANAFGANRFGNRQASHGPSPLSSYNRDQIDYLTRGRSQRFDAGRSGLANNGHGNNGHKNGGDDSDWEMGSIGSFGGRGPERLSPLREEDGVDILGGRHTRHELAPGTLHNPFIHPRIAQLQNLLRRPAQGPYVPHSSFDHLHGPDNFTDGYDDDYDSDAPLRRNRRGGARERGDVRGLFGGDGRNNNGQTYVPATTVQDLKDNTKLYVDLPGVRKEDIEISVMEGGRVVVVAGKRDVESTPTSPTRNNNPTSSNNNRDHDAFPQRLFGNFEVVLHLSRSIDSTQATTDLVDGVLELVFPKKEAEKIRLS